MKSDGHIVFHQKLLCVVSRYHGGVPSRSCASSLDVSSPYPPWDVTTDSALIAEVEMGFSIVMIVLFQDDIH